jgi:glutamate-1-semialdehyde aminotransferase
VLFGHNNTFLNQAMFHQMYYGTVYSLGSMLEVETAERFQSIFPFIKRLRFLKTGSEACSASIKIARAFNGKNIVLSEGYHGWHDEFVSLTPPAYGVAKHNDPSILPLNETTLTTINLKTVSAIIVEPVITDMSQARFDYLNKLREICDKNKIILIFDETITGYRFPSLCVASYCNVIPDLIVLGKAIGGGLPLSLVGGDKKVMEADYFVSSTFAGDCLSLATAKEASHLIKSTYDINALWNYGKAFKDQFNEICKGFISIEGYNTRGVFKADRMIMALYFQEMCKAGVLFCSTWFYNKHLHEELENVLNITKSVINKIRLGEVKLEGKLPVVPFAQIIREVKL